MRKKFYLSTVPLVSLSSKYDSSKSRLKLRVDLYAVSHHRLPGAPFCSFQAGEDN